MPKTKPYTGKLETVMRLIEDKQAANALKEATAWRAAEPGYARARRDGRGVRGVRRRNQRRPRVPLNHRPVPVSAPTCGASRVGAWSA